MKHVQTDSARTARAPRRDGAATRAGILEAAGKVFAERGYADATSKDICAAARVNNAAVNYYFGGKEGLYEAVLVEAHGHLLRLEDLDGIVASQAALEEKLRDLFSLFVRASVAAPRLWGVKVFLRELAAPSPSVNKALHEAVLPKAAKLRELVGSALGMPQDSAVAQRGAAFVILPCISLVMFPESLRTKVLPATAANGDDLLEDLVRYAVGGLRALVVP